jgi:hypothetical protein
MNSGLCLQRTRYEKEYRFFWTHQNNMVLEIMGLFRFEMNQALAPLIYYKKFSVEIFEMDDRLNGHRWHITDSTFPNNSIPDDEIMNEIIEATIKIILTSDPDRPYLDILLENILSDFSLNSPHGFIATKEGIDEPVNRFLVSFREPVRRHQFEGGEIE